MQPSASVQSVWLLATTQVNSHFDACVAQLQFTNVAVGLHHLVELGRNFLRLHKNICTL